MVRGSPLDIQGAMEVWVGQIHSFFTPQPGDFFFRRAKGFCFFFTEGPYFF